MNNSSFLLLFAEQITIPEPPTTTLWVESPSGVQMATPDGIYYIFIE